MTPAGCFSLKPQTIWGCVSVLSSVHHTSTNTQFNQTVPPHVDCVSSLTCAVVPFLDTARTVFLLLGTVAVAASFNVTHMISRVLIGNEWIGNDMAAVSLYVKVFKYSAFEQFLCVTPNSRNQDPEFNLKLRHGLCRD